MAASHPKHLPADERRALTIAAAVALAGERNPDEITTTAIAGRMHLSQAAIFKHFPTKETIWEAVMDWVAERLLARVDAAARGAASPLAALEAMFLAHADFIAAHPGVPRMLFGELQRSDDTAAKRVARTLLRQYGQRLHTVITRGQSDGELCRATDPAAASTLFIGALQGLAMQALLAGEVHRIRKDAPGAFAIFARGLRSHP